MNHVWFSVHPVNPHSYLPFRYFSIQSVVICLIINLFFFICGTPVFADTQTQGGSLYSGDPRGGSEFGYSVDADGSYALRLLIIPSH